MKMKKLIEKTEKCQGSVLAAKNIRTELKICFPNQKFSVTSESFSMGDAVRVGWTDGPTTEEIRNITNKYVYGTFDSMTDCSGIQDTFCDGLYGEAKYVTNNRTISEEVKNKAIAEYNEKYGEEYNEFSNQCASLLYRSYNEKSFYVK